MPDEGSIASPFRLLVAANLRQSWRKLAAARESSRFLTAVIVGFLIGYAALSFLLFYKGLRFIQKFPGLDTLLTERLLYLLFAFFFVLLLFSNLIISYTNLFRNRETIFLLSLPVQRTTIFHWKLLESAVLASWAFMFLIAPLLAAFGFAYHAPWHFYFATVFLTALFIVLPSVFGAFAAVTLGRFLDRRAFQITLGIAAILFLIVARFWLQPEPISQDIAESRVLALLDKMLSRTRFAQNAMLPSYWISSSVLFYVEGALHRSFFFALVLLSNVLFFGFLALTRLGDVFYDASSAVHSRGGVLVRWRARRAPTPGKLQHALAPGVLERLLRLLWFVSPERRALILKDSRVFWRDTTQWGQTLVLFGLLGGYILNLRHFSEQITSMFWINIISYLNMGACCLNLATLTTRFVYPQFSLEGKRVWIVGMAPLGLTQVVLTKFAHATTISLIITVGLVFSSCEMLQLPWDRTVFFTTAITIMTLVLNALAVGLGVLYPNFKEDNPSKIVSGFGGTFCLVASFLYILASVIALAFGSPWAAGGNQPLRILVLAWTAFALMSLIVGWLPLRLALHKLQTTEL